MDYYPCTTDGLSSYLFFLYLQVDKNGFCVMNNFLQNRANTVNRHKILLLTLLKYYSILSRLPLIHVCLY